MKTSVLHPIKTAINVRRVDKMQLILVNSHPPKFKNNYMTIPQNYPNAPDVSAEDYLVVGLATCFVRNDGEIIEVKVIEPIPSAALEAIMKGVPTSYLMACATTLGNLLDGEVVKMPADFPPDTQISEDFTTRAIAAVRTYRRRPEATAFIPVGSTYQKFNYSLERKRVLNAENIVSTEDNVKQHAYTHQVL